MLQKIYKNQGNVAVGVDEPAVAFKKTPSNRWNPNVPFTCTPEEFRVPHCHKSAACGGTRIAMPHLQTCGSMGIVL